MAPSNLVNVPFSWLNPRAAAMLLAKLVAFAVKTNYHGSTR